jgi:hypothetical protein
MEVAGKVVKELERRKCRAFDVVPCVPVRLGSYGSTNSIPSKRTYLDPSFNVGDVRRLTISPYLKSQRPG